MSVICLRSSLSACRHRNQAFMCAISGQRSDPSPYVVPTQVVHCSELKLSMISGSPLLIESDLMRDSSRQTATIPCQTCTLTRITRRSISFSDQTRGLVIPAHPICTHFFLKRQFYNKLYDLTL